MDIDQLDLFEAEATRSVLDQLLTDSRLYHSSQDYKDLLSFVARMRNFAPFNAMLLQIQKPGLSHAASAADWRDRFGRKPKPGARPLLILWPFGPVALVYDVLDTEGRELPKDVASYWAQGPIDNARFASFTPLLWQKHIEMILIDAGDDRAGSIEVKHRAITEKERTQYLIQINRNHSSAVQFSTLAHELAHLCLGHLGEDKALSIPDRTGSSHAQIELEAESAAYVLCGRNGVESNSEKYLSNYVANHTTVADVDVAQLIRAVNQVEVLLKLTAQAKFGSTGGR
jgi:hypothetical protein